MRNIFVALPTLGAAALTTLLAASSAHAQTGTDLLQNGGFEYMVTGLVTGNNISTTPPAGWTVSAGETNIQQGPANGTNAATPLAPYNGPYSGAAAGNPNGYNSNTDTGGNHTFDGTNDNASGFTILYQNFTISATATLTGSFALGARDAANGTFVSGAGQAGTSSGNTTNTGTTQIQILNVATGTAVPISLGAASTTTYRGDTSAIAVGAWEVNSFTVKNLAPGNYRFQVSLYGSQNIDGISLVPEPSTLAAAGAGLGLLLTVRGLRRRR